MFDSFSLLRRSFLWMIFEEFGVVSNLMTGQFRTGSFLKIVGFFAYSAIFGPLSKEIKPIERCYVIPEE